MWLSCRIEINRVKVIEGFMNKELGMTREEAWRLMKAYRTGLPWTAQHIIALRLLIDEDFNQFMRLWYKKGNDWACIDDLVEAIIRHTGSQRIPA